MAIQFKVQGEIPPKKDGAASMWRKTAGIRQLAALREAAADAFGARPPYDEPVTLTLRLWVPAPEGEPTLWMRRQHGDLDNFVSGVCDGLQAADTRGFDDESWTDVAPAVHPSRPIAFTDDSWIRRLEAELLASQDDAIAYEVKVAPLAS